MRTLKTQLVIKKEVVSNLNKTQMFSVRGGTTEVEPSTGGTANKRCSTNRPACCECVPCGASME